MAADSTDSTLKIYFILWASGLIAGVVLIERWRRKGRQLIPFVPTEPATVETVEAPSAVTTPPVPRDKPTVPAALVAGAKADVARVRRVALQATPWTRQA